MEQFKNIIRLLLPIIINTICFYYTLWDDKLNMTLNVLVRVSAKSKYNVFEYLLCLSFQQSVFGLLSGIAISIDSIQCQ